MRGRQAEFIPFVPGDIRDFIKYCDEMSHLGTWEDNLTLQAMCAVYKAYVRVLKENQDGTRDWLDVGNMGQAQSVFYLYLKDHHYENLVQIVRSASDL